MPPPTLIADLTPTSAPSLATDLALAGLVVAVITMMALPLPPWTIDILVATNISTSVVMLLLAMFVASPLSFSTFPSVLLITTLFRISLSVATTRQILLHAHAGDIINTFGRMVVGGSLVVGLVVFMIITLVQFIVIAKGAERVAEVGARFTLDALPGKQMSIDADLRAGVITQADALAKRIELVRESQFYGAMDGAMKFVKGDAVAGIVIVLVNLIGGITIGTLSLDLGLQAAIQRFSVLSIGDGLVTQIPSLFVAISAGIAITRTAPDNSSNLGQQIARQLGSQPRALMLAAAVMGLFALVPGFPTMTFLLLASMVAATSWSLRQRQRRAAEARAASEVPSAARDGENRPMLLTDTLPRAQPPSSFRLELAPDVAARFTAAGLDAALATERARWRQHSGLPFPGLPLLTSAARPAGTFAVLLQDMLQAEVTLPEKAVLALSTAPSDGALTSGPALLAPCHWVDGAAAAAAREAGTEVLEGAEIAARVATQVMQRNAAAVLGVQEVRMLLKELEVRHVDLVREAQAVLPLPRLADLLTTLARESVPLTDLPALLQVVVTQGPAASDTNGLYEAVRLGLARSIVARLLRLGAQRKLPALSLSREFEDLLRGSLATRPDGPVLALGPEPADKARQALVDAFGQAEARVLALPADLRRSCSRLFRTALPNVAFLSHDELSASGAVTDVKATIALG